MVILIYVAVQCSGYIAKVVVSICDTWNICCVAANTAALTTAMIPQGMLNAISGFGEGWPVPSVLNVQWRIDDTKEKGSSVNSSVVFVNLVGVVVVYLLISACMHATTISSLLHLMTRGKKRGHADQRRQWAAGEACKAGVCCCIGALTEDRDGIGLNWIEQIENWRKTSVTFF